MTAPDLAWDSLIPALRVATGMETEAAFDGAAFLGLARGARRDSHRLALFARHLEPGERVRAVIPVPGGTLLATDRRLLETHPHLEVDGAWNVREFQGYSVSRQIPLSEVRDAHRWTGSPADRSAGYREVEDVLTVETLHGIETFLLSRGPAPALTEAEFARLVSVLLPHAK